MNKYEHHAREQGFDLSLSNSPIDTPKGWHDGSVHQTGGYVMVRTWRTWDGHGGEYSGNDIEYEVAYGEQAGVSLQKYEWNDEYDAYEWVESLIDRTVEDNSDVTKAYVAKELMENFNRND